MADLNVEQVAEKVANTMREVKEQTGFEGRDLHRATLLVMAEWALENGGNDLAKKWLDRAASM